MRWERDRSIGNRENPGIQDTGNGALAVYETAPDCPGIQRVTVRPYARPGHGSRRWYQTADGRRWDTLSAARRAGVAA